MSDEVVLDTPEDDALLDRLRRVTAQADAPPPVVLDLARAAFALRDLDAELAVLVLDSETAGAELTGVRGEDDVRLLSYEASRLGLELQLDGRDLLGQVVGGVAESVVVETDDGEHPVQADADGVFRYEGATGARVRVRLRGTDGLTVVTPWTAL